MFTDEPYIDRFGYEVAPTKTVDVIIKMSIMVTHIYGSPDKDRRVAIVAMGNKVLSEHFADSGKEAMEAAVKWIDDNFTVPDSYTVYARMGLSSNG